MSACEEWTPASDAARLWCDHCGVRADLHEGSGRIGEAVARIVRRGDYVVETLPSAGQAS